MKKTLLASFAILLTASQANAQVNYDPGNVSGVTNAAAESLIETIGIGADHRSFLPAAGLGTIIGLDVGLDVTGINLPDDFRSAMQLAGAGSPPSLIPLPRLGIHKGLPLGIDIGGTYIKYQDNKIISLAAKWAFIPGGMAVPAVAVAVSKTWVDLFFMKTQTIRTDLMVSKGLGPIFEPYAGFGYQFVSGFLDVPIGGPQGLSTTVSAKQSTSSPHVFVGFPLKFAFFRLTPELDYSFAGVRTYGLKTSLSF